MATAFADTPSYLSYLEDRLSYRFIASDDPERLIPVFQKPEWIGIVVAGDPGRNQSKGYCSNHVQGPPVSKAVRLPADWNALLAKARS